MGATRPRHDAARADTGNLNQFLLEMPNDQKVKRIEDFDPVLRTSRFDEMHTMCVPQSQTSVETYLKIMEEDYGGLTVPRVNGTDLLDCMRKVYIGEATATMYDEPITLHLLADEFYNQGLCGQTGGSCYANGTIIFDRGNAARRRRLQAPLRRAEHDEEIPEPGTPLRACVCREVTEDGKCINDGRTFEPIPEGQLVTTGEIFNDLGYALAFPRYFEHLHYLAFSSVILW